MRLQRRRKRLTNVEAVVVLVRGDAAGTVIAWRVRARTTECEGKAFETNLAGFRLHRRRCRVADDGMEAKDNGKGEAFHGG